MMDKNIEIRSGKGVKTAPSVSVIIPAYNVTDFIAETLKSVFAQTYTDYEVIVINDGSPDVAELEKVLEPYCDRIVYIKQQNRGVSGARNTGLRLARAPFVALLDGDDAWLPNYLAVQMEIIKKDPTTDVVYGNAILFGNKVYAGRKWMDMFPSEGEVTFERLVSQQCNVLTSVTARRETMLHVGLFDESLRSSEDFDMWLRITKKGGRIVYHRQVLFRYRSRPNSLSNERVRMCNQILKVLSKAEQTLDLTPNEQRSLQKSKIRFQATLDLIEGKIYFFKGDAKSAIEKLTKANTFFKSRKISLLLQLLRVAPRFLLHVYNARDRFIFKTDTKID